MVENNKKYCVVLGGSNIDYIGFSNQSLINMDSNPGTIHINYGGVGRNITENIARLGGNVYFITAIGNDSLGVSMKKDLQSINVQIIQSNIPDNTISSSYMAIHNNKGDMSVAICDNTIVEYITKELIDSCHDIIDNSEFVVIDTNLSIDLIDYFFMKHSNKKILCDGISTTKVLKLKNHLSDLFLLKVNNYEFESLKTHVGDFHVENLIVTNGNKPILYYSGKENTRVVKIPIIHKDHIISTTGAGDAMLGAICYGILNDFGIVDAIKLGVAASSMTLDTLKTVNENIKNIL